MPKDNQQIKYASYRRKSTDDERQVLSLDSQDTQIKKQYSTLQIVDLPPESVSAHRPYKRPVFKKMLEMVEAGKVQGIIAWHPDRLSRNPIDAAQIIYLLDTGKLKDLKFCSSHFDNSPEGKMMLQITMSQSKYSSDKLGKDVKRGIDKKAAMGIRPTLTPLGYLNSKTNLKGEETIFSDPKRFDLVKQLWQTMMTGNYSVPAMAKYANEILHLTQPPTRKLPYERPVRVNVLYRLFTNPFCYGWYKWNDEMIQGTHEPMITEDEFNRVQKILGRPYKPHPKTHQFAFTGLMKCGSCGASITAEEKTKRQQNGNVHTYIYYRCTKKATPDCPERCLNLNEFNKQVDKVLEGLHISDRFQKWALRYLHEMRKGEAAAQENTFEAKQRELARLTKQLDNLLIKFTSPENSDGGLISDIDYKSLKSGLAKHKAQLEQELAGQGRDINDWLEMSERTFNFARYARIWFEKGDLNTKRAIFACLGSDFILKGQNVSLTLKKPFQFIFEGLSQAEAELLRLEPLQSSVNTIDYRVLSQKITVWSG